MTDFLTDESSVESSKPREFYKIVQSELVTYYVASGTRDIVHDGNTYVAEPVARTDLTVDTLIGTVEVVLALPLTHGLPRRYSTMGTPPRQIAVTVYRKQLDSGEVEIFREGYVTSMAIERHIARFQIPSRFKRALERVVPTELVDRACPHILYDKGCRIDPSGFTVSTTVVTVNGRRVTVVSAPVFGDENYAVGGDLRHNLTGEWQTLFTQTGIDTSGNVTFDMQAPIPEMKVGDAVTIRAGCLHDIATCHEKFANEVNYGGLRWLPAANIFLPGGWGVIA